MAPTPATDVAPTPRRRRPRRVGSSVAVFQSSRGICASCAASLMRCRRQSRRRGPETRPQFGARRHAYGQRGPSAREKKFPPCKNFFGQNLFCDILSSCLQSLGRCQETGRPSDQINGPRPWSDIRGHQTEVVRVSSHTACQGGCQVQET